MNAVRLTQIDGKLPNLALMKLGHWHRSLGHDVRFSRSVYRDMLEPPYHRVYGSAIFAFSAARIARFLEQFPGAIVGGTGTGETVTVESLIGDAPDVYDYSLYPQFTASIGFAARGCRLKCGFCVVPRKEGKPKSVNTIAQIWRGAPWPKHLHLLDNDFFGNPEWRDRIAEIRDGGFKVCFNQGINVRLIDQEIAEALASVQYRDDEFKQRRLYTAWDNLKDEKVFMRGMDMLDRTGIPGKHVMAYMLVGWAPDETFERVRYRFDRMVARGIRPYPMVFDRTRKDLLAFQRWVVTGLYRAVPWGEYRHNARRQTVKASGDLFA